MRDFQLPGRSTVHATNGMCATSHPLAAKVAIDILERGGNAADAAISASFLLGLCEPQMTGIGGDCFALISVPGQDIVALNGSGRAPKSLSAAKLRAQGFDRMPNEGPAAITIPGAVDAFCRLSDDFGALGLPAILAPAIKYARDGVPVAPRTSFDWHEAAARLQGKARDYFLFDGRAGNIGDIFRAPGQAEVLEKIATEGRSGFYEGEVAEDMVSALHAAGGVHTLADFAENECDYSDPISGAYNGIDLVEHPPNGQGATAILMNNMLAQFDVAGMDPFGSARAHLEAEIAKLAYDARNRFIADPKFTSRLEHMTSVETARALASSISMTRAIKAPAQVSGSVHKETVYLTVIDKDQMAVSMIYSIFNSFGSGIASDRFGILFQNRGAGFTLENGHPNEAGGGKRPMHTIIPGMLRKDDRLLASFGVMGGAYQPNGHSRFLSNVVDFGMDPQSAIDAPRSFSDTGNLKIERGYREQVRQELADLGHSVVVPNGPIGGAQAIFLDHARGILTGASDPRKDGCALGY